MVDERVGIAVILILTFGTVVLGQRLGLLRPDSRRWRTCLFFSVYGVVLVMTLDLLDSRMPDVTSLVFVAWVGALGGGLSGLLMSYLERRWPS